MVADQREAEQRKNTSLEIQAALEKQEAEVAMRKNVVLEDLAKAEPAVEEAKASVQQHQATALDGSAIHGQPAAGCPTCT